MQAGRRDRRISLQTFTEPADDFGQPVKTWTTSVTLWANVKPMRGAERFSGQQEIANADTVFTVTNYAALSVTTEMRVLYNSEYYDITSVIGVGVRDRDLEIYATRRME